jgi:hypothetical protein
VDVYSGKDGSFRSYINPPQWLYQCHDCWFAFGDAIAPAGDVDGDGVPDLEIGDPHSLDHVAGDVYFYSGLDGTMLFHFAAGSTGSHFGVGLEGAVDLAHDGRLDFVAGDTYDSTNGPTRSGAPDRSDLILDATPLHRVQCADDLGRRQFRSARKLAGSSWSE